MASGYQGEKRLYLGFQSGSFRDKDGRIVSYCHVFLAQPVEQRENAIGYGYSAAKERLDPALLSSVQTLEQFTEVRVFYGASGNRYSKIVAIERENESRAV